MKKLNILPILLYLTITISYAQKGSEKAKEFLSVLNSDKIIDKHYTKAFDKLRSSRNLLFNEFNLDLNDSTVINYFNQSINKSFNFYTQDTKQRIFHIYSNYEIDRLDDFIALAIIEEDFNKVLSETNYLKILNNILIEHRENFNHDLSILVRELKSFSEPLKLRLIIDNDTINKISKNNFNLEAITKDNRFKKIEILNKESLEIEIPKELKYDEIEYIILTYNGKKYNFFENHNENLPEHLKAILNKESLKPLSKYCFEKLLYWEVVINHKPENIPNIDRLFKPNEEIKGAISFTTRTSSIQKIE